MDKPNYKKTLRACYLGFITQAICANFAPLLFLTFHKNYQISKFIFEQAANTEVGLKMSGNNFGL